LLVDRITVEAVGRWAVRVTTHVPEPPGATVFGAQARLDRIPGAVFRVRVRLFDEPFNEAVTTAVPLSDSAPLNAGKAVEEVPPATGTEAGTLKALVLEERAIDTAEGAVLERVTVQDVRVLEGRADGVHCISVTMIGATKDRPAVAEAPLRVAATMAV